MGLTFIDLFAGIGGFRLGMQMAGHKPLGFVEWDKYARKSYEAIHEPGEEWTAHDITAVSDESIRGIGSVEVICGGFPCQAFSVAGKRAGFNDTRGTLFFEIMRFASILRPRYLFLENVTGLLSHDNGDTFETILRTMDEIGYDAEWDVLNSKGFGVPQSRERVFIIGHLRGESTRKVFPIQGENGGSIKIIGLMGDGFRQTNEVLDVSGVCTALRTFRGGNLQPKILTVGHLDVDIPNQNTTVYDPKGLSPTLRNQHGYGTPKIIDDQGRLQKQLKELDICPTLRAQSHGNEPKVLDGYRIRKLTPRECWRLQGLPDWAFDRAQAVNSDSQLYKQAGNSVTVNVIYAIASQLI